MVTSYSLLKWKEESYLTAPSNFVYNNSNYTESFVTDFLWHGLSTTSEFSSIIKWNNRMFLTESNISQWNNISFVEQLTDFLWRVKFNFVDYRFDQSGLDESYFDSGTLTIPSRSIIKWINREFLTISDVAQWNNREFTSIDLTNFDWENLMFIEENSIAKWSNYMFTPSAESIFQWNGVCYNTSSSIAQWNEVHFVTPELIAQWNETCYVSSLIKFLWLGAAGISFPLNDYLSVKTIQGKYIFPDIVGGSISFKDGSIGEATFELNQFIPEDSRCIFYLKGSARMFDGISRRCIRNSNGTYKVTVQEYNEILKPESGKGGYYLVKNNWHNIELHNLVSSLKPSDNNNEIGILYMASSAIPDTFFEEYDTENNIFKFEYTGIPYAITEVFEDVDLLSPQSNLEFLKSITLTTALIYGGTDTEVSVSSTAGYASSGSIYIESEQITYTSKTATKFEGCVRGAGSTVKAAHAVGTTVSPKVNSSCLLTVALTETIVSVNSTYGFASNGTIHIGSEDITYNSKNGTQFKGCHRGADGTNSADHAIGASVTQGALTHSLTIALTDDVISLSVNTTTGFDASGSVFIKNEEITYTSKTATSFRGCIRAVNDVSEKAMEVGSVVTHNTKVSGWYHDIENKILYIRCTDGAYPYYHVISAPYIWDSKVPIRIGNINNEVLQTSPITIYSGSSGGAKVPTLQPPSGGCYLRVIGIGTVGDIIITGVATDDSTTETISSADFSTTDVAISAKKWKSISNLNIETWTSVTIESSAPVISYWETANEDIPLDTLETLLTALNLEYEPVFRNGICYIDISNKIGAGTSTSPASYYNEKDNIIAIQEIDMADARNMINGVTFRGYGTGAAAVKSGKHINMGRGGRFILLDDSTIHSQSVAKDFAAKYLEEHYLPARSIKFSAPLFMNGAVDQRRLGDFAHISIPSEYLEQDLRVKEIAIKLSPLSQTLTFGDRLISWDDQLKAMREASEKYRKHLEDEIEEFSWSWSSNIDSKATRRETFKITDDNLKIQKLELTCTTDFHTTDTSSGSGAGEGGGGGGSGSEENPAGTISNTTHHHQVVGVTGSPSATIQVSAKGHTHTLNPVTGVPSAATTVVTGVTSVVVTLNPSTACCTAIGCGSKFLTEATTVTGGVGSVTSTSVSSAAHTHSVSGTTSGDDSYQSVPTFDHTHQINFQTSDAEAGTALFTEADYIAQFTYKDQGGILTNVLTGRPYGDTCDDGTEDLVASVYRTDPSYRFKATDIYTLFRGGGNPDLDPEMLLTIKIKGPGIDGYQEISGSPFVLRVSDDIGTVAIDNLVKEKGTYTVKVTLAHKTETGEKVQLKFSMQISGKIFVDTIVKE
jgi:hypothetical protein